MENNDGSTVIWNTHEEACAMASLALVLRNVFILADIESYDRMDLIALMDECIRRQQLEPFVALLDDEIEAMERDGSL